MSCDEITVSALDGVVVHLFIVEGIAMIISNMFVIIPIVVEKQLRKVNYVPLLSLAVADTITGMVMASFILSVTCGNLVKVMAGLMVFGQVASVMSIIVVCLDRWVAIFQPLRYRVLLHNKRLLGLTILAWIMAAVVSIPVAFFDKFEFLIKPNGIANCERIYIIIMCSMFICICSVLGYMQFRIICTVKHHLRRILPLMQISVAPAPSTSSYQETTSRASIQTNSQKHFRRFFKQREIALVIATNCVYLFIIITSTPFLVVTLLLLSTKTPKNFEKLMPITVLILNVNSFINPIIYAVRLKEFKLVISRMFCSFKCCKL